MFAEQTASLTLIPGDAGVFEVEVDGELIYSKHEQGRFPTLEELQEGIAARL